MASSWIRLDCKCRDSGWVGDLPVAQWAAWIKLLLETKANGRRGGIIPESHFTKRKLARLGIRAATWQALLVAAEANNALARDNGNMQIVNWGEYQGDPTNAERQERYREKENDVTEVTVTNENNADVTGRDGTVRDGTRQKQQPGESAEQRRTREAASLVKLHRETVNRLGDDTAGRGRSNVEKLLKSADYTYDQLATAVTNCAEAMTILERSREHRIAVGNFFGRAATFKEYLNGTYQRPEAPNSSRQAGGGQSFGKATGGEAGSRASDDDGIIA